MLTQEAIKELALDWYKKLDVHVPMVEVLPLLADAELEMVFPEATVYGYAGFEGWFQRVIRIFFDEVHTVKVVEPVINGDTAVVKVVVQWEASVWNAPEPFSKRIKCDAFQTWEVKLTDAGKVVITKYIVDGLEYHEGSATL
ncbi:hypothetical protein MUK70_09410 [Dyadobacter chenwenxiniae]|uniref:SnoaL-like domain-containing protein n=1 Tax=Dyadobacter chenwenxiniae TaxID=2906456 RepID=A0A9X1PM85_9BACT|nr:hypothetical protein [Dyadobacter chenwenxiniae]MCF0051890.1 hypothetical protein [Dyadobacter chenwenxiniae]MCF0063421.1 hypothetical protein [Dyadobacter chenwenxiniae]UON85200.1 hypothetical protein MUK70_09410 [Dyadobacter chenwenxiniae]